MKVFIVLAAFVVVASAGKTGYAGFNGGAISTGTSSQFRSEDNYGNYNFGYDESHSTGGTSRREEQTNGVRRGSYSLTDADGRQRTVDYIADVNGFRATIRTNEPGVEAKDPADVLINKNGGAGGYGAAPAPLALPAPAFQQAPAYQQAPLPAPKAYQAAPLPAPVSYAVKGYAAPAPAPLAAPLPAAAPVSYGYGPREEVYEPTPRAFSYSFGSTHAAPSYQVAAPIAAPAPIYQQRIEAY